MAHNLVWQEELISTRDAPAPGMNRVENTDTGELDLSRAGPRRV